MRPFAPCPGLLWDPRRTAEHRDPAAGVSRRVTGADGPAEVFTMAALLIVLLLAVVLFGLGFALKVLWWIAAAVLVVWLLGFVFRAAEGSGRRRWYRW